MSDTEKLFCAMFFYQTERFTVLFDLFHNPEFYCVQLLVSIALKRLIEAKVVEKKSWSDIELLTVLIWIIYIDFRATSMIFHPKRSTATGEQRLHLLFFFFSKIRIYRRRNPPPPPPPPHLRRYSNLNSLLPFTPWPKKVFKIVENGNQDLNTCVLISHWKLIDEWGKRPKHR